MDMHEALAAWLGIALARTMDGAADSARDRKHQRHGAADSARDRKHQ
jgi:hypothetical protein